VTAALCARGVGKRFTRRGRVVEALTGVDLEVMTGELVLVTGPSLSGKTTLVHLLAGWLPPDSGAVEWAGKTTPAPWSELSVITQAPSLLEELTVAENVSFASRVGPSAHDPGEAADLFVRLGLARLLGRLPSEISVGERQRVMVARALVGRPTVVLADEPVMHQDDRHADIVLSLLSERAAAGAACVVAARSDARLRAIADRVVELPTHPA
jgi:ABC-type lipoprotein export system ATPase subunit